MKERCENGDQQSAINCIEEKELETYEEMQLFMEKDSSKEGEKKQCSTMQTICL